MFAVLPAVANFDWNVAAAAAATFVVTGVATAFGFRKGYKKVEADRKAETQGRSHCWCFPDGQHEHYDAHRNPQGKHRSSPTDPLMPHQDRDLATARPQQKRLTMGLASLRLKKSGAQIFR
jgi:hypothetical protein